MGKKIAVLLISLMALCAFPGRSEATIVTFDSLSGTGTLTNQFSMTWSQWNYSDAPNPIFPAHSEKQRIYNPANTNSANNSMQWTTPVLFNGAWFSGNKTTSVRFVSIKGNVRYESAWMSMYENPNGVNESRYLKADFAGVTSVWVEADYLETVGGYGYFSMDDVTYNERDVNPVPEPASLVLLGSGFIGMFFRRKFVA